MPAPMKQMAITLIEQSVQAGARTHKACEVLCISVRTLRRWRAAGCALADQRKGAAKRCSHALDEHDRQRILDVCNQPAHQSLPPSQIVPRLADAGIYIASESSFYRVLRTQGQRRHRGRAKAPRHVARPRALCAHAANQVWSWDITYLPSTVRGQFYRLYLVLDVYSRMIVGWEVHHDECAQHAATLISKTCLRHKVSAQQLVLHSDNGSPMKGVTMLATLQKLGIMPSFSRPCVNNDNPYSEALFRTLKYAPAYPEKPFADIDQARCWVQTFVLWYNEAHRHSAIRFVTPAQRHAAQDAAILAQLQAVYLAAKQALPERWRGRNTRNWQPVGTVWLNPDKPTTSNDPSMPQTT